MVQRVDVEKCDGAYAKVSIALAFLSTKRSVAFNVLLGSKSEPQRKRVIIVALTGLSGDMLNLKALIC